MYGHLGRYRCESPSELARKRNGEMGSHPEVELEALGTKDIGHGEARLLVPSGKRSRGGRDLGEDFVLKDLIGARKYIGEALKEEIHWILKVAPPPLALDGSVLVEVEMEPPRGLP